MKISVIVPIYNVEKYLRRCIDSIINQTYKNLEIILVNDGSLDGSLDICKKYKKIDSRIKLVNKNNGGLSSARNEGLKIATGDYISFIDSDDWIKEDMYENLLNNAIKYNADISVGGVADLLEKEDSYEVIKSDFDGVHKIECISREEAIEKFLMEPWAAWDKIYKREVHENLYFPLGEINEDEAIALKLLDKCNNIVYDNKVFYNYIKRKNSITTSEFNEKKFDWYKHCKNNLNFIEKKYPKLIKLAEKRLLDSMLWSLNSMIDINKDYEEYRKDIILNIKSRSKSFCSNIYVSKKSKFWIYIILCSSINNSIWLYKILYKLNKIRYN